MSALERTTAYNTYVCGVEERRPRKVIEEKGWGKKVVWISAFEWRVHSLSFPVCCFKEEIQGYLILDVFFRVADSTLSRKRTNPPIGGEGERDHECVSKPQPLSIIRKERNLNLRFYILVETGIRRQPFLCSASFKHAIFARHPQALCVSFCRLFTVELALTLCAR